MKNLIETLRVALVVAFTFFVAISSVQADPQSLQLQFDWNNLTTYQPDNVWFTFQNPSLGTTNFDVTYKDNGGTGSTTSVTFGSATDIMSTPVQLSTIGSNGFTFNKGTSVAVFVYYGSQPTATSGVPSYIGGGTDYNSIFQPFEITMQGSSANTGDQGNLTNINYFAIPLSITSYKNGTVSAPNQLQQTGYNSGNAVTLGTSLANVTNNSNLAVIPATGGGVARVIGPSSYGANTNPYPSFQTYLQHINQNAQATLLQRANAFNANNDPQGTNYNFQINLTATVDASNNINITGNISTIVTPYGGSQSAGPTFNDVNITFSGADMAQLNQAIYGQSDASAVSYSGTGWDDFIAYATTNGLIIPGVMDAVSTTKAMSVGEITTGLLGGYVDSNYVPAIVNGMPNSTAIKDLPSNTRWNLDPIIGFNEIQPSDDYYNIWSQLIFDASGNTVYSVPYSDRFGSGPLVNTVNYNGDTVTNWVVGLYDPVTVPEPSSVALLGIGLGLGMLMLRRRKSATA